MNSIGILGPIALISDDREIHLPRRSERLLLGILALTVNKVVTQDRLVDLLWTGDPPGNAPRTIRVYVSRLRSALRGIPSFALSHRGGGYVLAGNPDDIDAGRFMRLVDHARRVTDDQAVATLHEADAL